ncbi:MAG: hypothetical protein J6T98_08930 [Salinivirgaceae bacterium]|nr:hypothetical protein [Bacteroidales bacterium]MBO7496666.1 hypothetical protein [Salinivirgaceae bacterium]
MAEMTQERWDEIFRKEKELYAKQRAEQGFCDRDVWHIAHWFYSTIGPMLRQLAEKGHSCATLDEKGNRINSYNHTKEELEIFAQRWRDTLLRMAFLADEMDNEKCSMKNPYEEDWKRVHKAFEDEYGSMGEKLGKGFWHFPEEDPVHGKEYKKVLDNHSAYRHKIGRYQNKCKNEFFRLFSKHFWDLWD